MLSVETKMSRLISYDDNIDNIDAMEIVIHVAVIIAEGECTTHIDIYDEDLKHILYCADKGGELTIYSEDLGFIANDIRVGYYNEVLPFIEFREYKQYIRGIKEVSQWDSDYKTFTGEYTALIRRLN